jgi:hypothetical protein
MTRQTRSDKMAVCVALALAGGVASCGSSSNSSSTPPPANTDGGGDAGGTATGAPSDCVSGDTKACSSFTTPTGMMIPLGPSGAAMDPNVGTGFENAVQAGDMLPANASMCQSFANLFMEDPKLTAQLLNTNQNGVDLNFALYTVYRPATWPAGPVPVITWGNGTCAQPEGYGALLRYVASNGYFVVAANSRWVGSGSPQPMLHALDFAAAANADSSSPYYKKLDLTKVGAMGHSQGGSATVMAAADSRIQDIIIFNAADTAPKPYLAISGDMDITGFTAAGMSSAVNAATVPAAYLFYHNPAGMGPLKGHLVLMLSPDRVTVPTVAWWQMMFHSDATSRAQFVGATCGLCADTTNYAFGEQGL